MYVVECKYLAHKYIIQYFFVVLNTVETKNKNIYMLYIFDY